MLVRFGFLPAFVCGLCVGCGQDERATRGLEVPFNAPATGVPAFGEVPWPSDLYLDDSGSVGVIPGLERVASHYETLQEGLSALDGFGRSTGALFFVDGPIDPDSLPRTWDEAVEWSASVRIVDVDPASPLRGKRYPAYAKGLASLGAISVIPVPGVVLPPGVEHAVVLTTRVRTLAGAPLLAAPELVAYATTPAGSRASRAAKLYGDAIDELVRSGGVVGQDEIASLAVFRTSNRVRELPELRARLRQLPEPELLLGPSAAPYTVKAFGVAGPVTLSDWLGTPDKDELGREWPGGDNAGGIAHDQIALVAHAAFVAPSFLDADTHRFEKDATGLYVLAAPDAKIPVTLVIPKKPAPPGGYPVVVNGHGLSNDRGSMFGVANELCRVGFAVIGIDDVLHGARGGIVDQKNNYAGSYDGPDGIPDEKPLLPLKFFAGFSDFVIVRDNFRQTVLDQTSLVRLVQSSKLDLSPFAAAAGGTAPKLDPTRIYWSGGSLGGIMGAMTMAVEPEIRGAALQVPGAAFVQLITTSSAKVAPLVSLALGTFGVQGEDVLDEFHPLGTLLGAITEAGDPIGYASHVMRDPLSGRTTPDLMISYAVGDEVLPNVSTIALMRALGVEIVTPALVDVAGIATRPSPVSANVEGRAGVAVQYAPANHALGYMRWDLREFMPGVPFEGEQRFPRLPAPFNIEMPVREHATQLAEFFTSSNDGKAVVRVTAPPRADFDGDGALDTADADPINPKKK